MCNVRAIFNTFVTVVHIRWLFVVYLCALSWQSMAREND